MVRTNPTGDTTKIESQVDALNSSAAHLEMFGVQDVD